MGEVYLGHDTVLDRAVAIKLIGSRSPDATSRERFLIEARAIARLSHPNVVTIFRVGTTADGRPFLVQELIRGTSLDHAPRPMPWRTVCELAIGVARGLDAAHRRGILHRDIKPANVMIDDRGTARLLDFGLAKLGDARAPRELPHGTRPPPARDPATDDVAATRDLPQATPALADGDTPIAPSIIHTAPGAVVGTPRYTSPEGFRGEPASTRSDLYSLGVMLYELLAGAPPFPEADYAALTAAVLAGKPRPVRELAPDAHPALAAAVMRCLDVDPRARPATAAELAHELESALVDAPSVPGGNPYRGLRAFDAAHRALFFGRGNDVGILVDRLRSEPLVVVVGDSGIGKSSVCHAGVAPAVTAGALGGDRTWRSIQIALGRAPWTALCEALGTDTLTTARALRPAPGTGLLLVIDQLEELVTIADPDEAAQVAAFLASLADNVPGIKALLAVRGDFLTRVATLPELGGPMTRGLHLLRVLSRDDLQEAIVGPARAHAVRFETPTMVDALVDAVAQQPGALPLLQFTLAELWTARDIEGAVIPDRALTALGGVEGALAGHADRILLTLDTPAARTAARRIVLRLVSDERTRAVRERDELATADDPTTLAALESLIRGRLVVARDTVSGTPTYELAHEALIRSWTTLRDWLDEAAGEVAARNRLFAAAREWARVGKKPDLLWSRRQLDEAHALADLAPTEHAFLVASRAQLRRRRATRIAAIIAIPLLATAIFAAVRLDAARRRDREVAARVTAATTFRTSADAHARRAADTRTRAFAAFDAGNSPDGERIWADARAAAAAADQGYRQATRELEAAFLVEAGSVRAPMAATLWSHAELAEATYDREKLADLLDRLETYDAAMAARWNAPGRFTLDVDTPASVAIHARVPDGPLSGFDAQPMRSAGQHVDLELPPGSYLAIATATDGRTVRLPFVLGRGERYATTLAIPREMIDGYVYVPAGRFLFGSDLVETLRRDFLHAAPLFERSTPGYWIARDEVTFADWLEYLRALPVGERVAHWPHVDGKARALELERVDERFVLRIAPTDVWMRAAEGELLANTGRDVRPTVRWEQMPVIGITPESAIAYTAWLARGGGVPGARLCTIDEWERAARGADGRPYPHGAALTPALANYDATYEGGGDGLDEVGSYPTVESPFGLRDMTGNAAEIVRMGAQFLNKGGSFYQGALTAYASNITTIPPTLKNVMLGVRVCASAEHAR